MCDCLCALPPATAARRTLFAKGSDRPPDEPQQVAWFAPRRDHGPLRTTHIEIDAHGADTIGFVGSRPTWQWGVEHGVNEAAVAAGNETIYTTLDPRGAPAGLIGLDLVRLGLERGATASDAVDVMTALLERHGQGGSGHRDADRPYWSSFLVADPERAFVLETSGTAWAVEEVARTRAISNRTTIPSFDATHRHPSQPVERLVDPRLRASVAVLADEPVSVADLKAHLRSHTGGADGWTVCMHVPGIEATTGAVIADLDRDRAVAWFLMGSPCRSVFVPLLVGDPFPTAPAWERFAALRPEHRPVLDALEARLEGAIDRDDGVDRRWNERAWAEVERTISDLVCDP